MTELLNIAALGLNSDFPVQLDQQIWLDKAEQVAQELAETAVERDQRGGHPADQRELLRESGLLGLSIPLEYGGQGAKWPLIYQVIRRIARADSALAHIFAFHHLQVGSVSLYGTTEQKERLLTLTARKKLFWGNTLNPLDRNTLAIERGDGGFVFDGRKSFCSGALGSDYITASAWHEASQSLVVAALPTSRKGITIHDDWDAIGQRQTDSGTASFDQVQVEPEDVLLLPGKPWGASAHFRANLAQLVLVNLFVGIAEGALIEARRYLLEDARPWLASDADRAENDLLTQRQFGELWARLRAAQVLTDRAAERVGEHYPKGNSITLADRGETAIAIAEAKVLAHHAALDISSRLFDLAGARATDRRYGYDRFWRNARTHTLHDPLEYKLRDLGRWVLKGDYPNPTSYS